MQHRRIRDLGHGLLSGKNFSVNGINLPSGVLRETKQLYKIARLKKGDFASPVLYSVSEFPRLVISTLALSDVK